MNLILIILSANLLLTRVKGNYNLCPDASFQSVTSDKDPVQCKSICFRRDFTYYQLSGKFCFCSNSNSCSGFGTSVSTFPVVLSLTASDGFISEPVQVDVEVKLADSSYSGVVDLVLDGFQTSILSTDGVVSYKVLKTYLKPGETKIKASASSDGLTINNSTTITVRCKMIIGHQLPSNLTIESGVVEMLYINLIAGYNVYVKVMTDDQDKYSFLIMDPKVLVAGRVFTSSTETSPKVLYFSDVSLHKGYIYGIQLLASSAGSVDLEVRCGETNSIMNSTSLDLVKGLNSFILTPFEIEKEDCFVALRTDEFARLYIRNPISYSTDIEIADLSLSVFTSQPREIWVPVHWDSPGTHSVLFIFTSFDELVEKSTDIVVLDSVQGLDMSILLNDQIYIFKPGVVNELTVTVLDEVVFYANVTKGTDVVYNWDPDPNTLTFTTLTTQKVRVTADNPLSKPQTVEVMVRVTDQEFEVSDLEVMSEIMLQKRTEDGEIEAVLFLTGEEVQISCNITGGTGMKITLQVGDETPLTIQENLYNKNSKYLLSYSYTYTSPLLTSTLTLCVANTVNEKCRKFPPEIAVIKRVQKPNIEIPEFIERGRVIPVKSDVTADNYLWTLNVPEVEMILTQNGLSFPDNIDIAANSEASHSFYFNKIGSSTIGLYVYNLLSWEYTEKRVYVESLVGDVPVSFLPEKYASTDQPVKLTINCPNTATQQVNISTSEVEDTVECLLTPVEYILTFTSAGEQLVTISTFNNISSSDQTYTIIVQDLVELNFSVVSEGISPNTSVAVGSTVSLVAAAGEVFSPQPGLVVTWSISDVIVNSHELVSGADITLVSSVAHKFDLVGDQDIECCVQNNVSSSCAHNTMRVLTPVSGLVITYANTSYVIAPGQAVHLRVSAREGSELRVVAKIGENSYEVQMSNKQGTLQHEFGNAGVFPVTVSAYNDISSITKSLPSFIYVQNQVQGVSLLDHSSEKQEMDKSTLRTSEVYLTVLIERGTNATVRCNFGVDSTSIVTVEAQHSPFNLVVAEREQTITCKYRYKTTGVFSPSVRVYNSISDINIPSSTIPVFLVEIPVEGGDINLPDTTMIDRQLQLDYSLVAGSNVIHTWYIDDVQFDGAVFQPEQEGIYIISLTLENNLNSLTVSKEVSVESKLSSVTFAKNLELYHKLSNPVEFEVVLAPEAKFNVRYHVDMGDGKVFNSSRVSHLYPDIGVYQISLKVSNSISKIGLVKTLNVQDEILRVMIKGSLMVLERQLSSFNAEVFKKSTTKLEENVHYIWKLDGATQEQDASDFSILLDNPGTYTLSLTVYNDVSEQSVSETLVVTSNTSCHPPGVHITGGDNIRVLSTDTVLFEAVIETNCENKHTIKWSVLTLERASIQDFLETRSKTLKFRASFLEAGSYIVRLVVYVTESPEVYRSDEVMMTVVSVPLIPVLNYPTFTTTNTKETLEISLVDSLILNESLSLEDFNFSWSCRFRSAQRTYNPCTELHLSNSPNISAHFNVSGFADLSVNISLGGEDSSTWRHVGSTNIVLNVTNYVVPLLKLSVLKLHELSPEKRTVASLQCSHRGVPCFNPTVEWRVQLLESSECETGAELEDLPPFSLSEEMTTTGLTNRNLVIQAGVFRAGGTYKIEGCVWQGVCAGQLLTFNCGPTQGHCSVELGDDGLVEVSCHDWVSQSGQLQYHVTYATTQFPVMVYSGPKSSSRFLLPPGEQAVTMSVSDSSGARTSLPPVTISVPSQAGYELNTTELLHGNEYQLVLQIINSDVNNPDTENDSVPEQWASELREVLAGINNTGDISTYLSSLSFTVANFLNTNANEEGLQLFIEFLEMLLTFLKEVLTGRYSLPDNSLDVILEILNKLLSLTRKLFSSEDPKLYLPLLNRAYTLCDDVTALVLTIQLNERVSGEEDLVQKQQFVGVLGRKLESDTIRGETFETSGYKFQLPHSVDFQREECVQGHMVLYDENPYGALDPVSSHVSSLTLRYCNGSEIKVEDTREDITITLPVNDTKGNTESVFSVLTHKRDDISTTNQYKVEKQANVHRIQINNNGALTVQITEMNTATNVPLSVLVGVDKVPDSNDFTKSGLVEKTSSLSFHFTAEQLSQFNASELVLSVTNYENPALPYDKQTPPLVRKYNIQYWYSQCLYRTPDGWSEEGCKSSENSSPREAVCRCSHLTLFASRHFVTPNKLDIGTILTTRRLEDGHVVLTLSCTLLFIYLVTLTILVKLDIVRGSSSSVIYLEDNYVRDKQGYLVRIVTGSQPNAGTTAKVNIKLYGKQRDGPARLLSAQRPLFSSKSRESFVLKFPTSLGKLHHIHIWHDNSGKDPSWFLENVTVTDLNTNRTRYFPCHEWLAIEEGNGDMEKMIPCSKSPYKTRWDAFISNASFSEHHLWASIFKDHTYANFSKPQRLTVCFTLIFIAMAINVAFWNPALDTTFHFTIFNIGMEVVSQGVLTGVILLPFIVGIIILFRRSQTRIPLLVYPDSTKVLSQSSINDADLAGDCKRRAGLTPVLEELSTPRSAPLLESPGSSLSCDGGVSLPWWCAIVGWILCFLAISCSVVVSTFYGMQFGNNKSLQWLASFFVSLLESIFISQPLIVLGCGIYASLSFGKKKKGRPLSKADTMTLNFMLPRNFTTKAYEGLARLKAFRFRSTKPPAHKATTLAAREECLRRKELGELVNSLLLHIYLLVVVLLSANSSLPDRGHWSVRGVDVAFTGRGASSIYNVTTRDGWYNWMEDVLTKSAFWEPSHLDLRGFTRDGGFYRLGSIRLRMQLRDVCDNGNCVENGVPSSIQSTYSDKTGFSTAGTFTWYDESGHVIYLPATREDSLNLLQSLKSHSWINKATSVVFVEMSLYTPSTNTFVDVKYITEFPDFCSTQSRVVVSPLHVLFRNSTQEILLFVVLGTYVVGLVLLLREIFHTYVEHGSTPSLTYNTILAVFMIGSFVIHLTRILEVNHLRNRIIEKAEFLDLSTLNFLTTTMMLCYGMSTFLLIMRSILILKFFRLINVFHVVLFIALKNVLHFAIFLIITIVIFALTGMILFGSQVIVFSSFTKSVMALLAVLTRNMEYVQFKEVAPIVAPLYFIVFYGVTYVVLSRIVAAIFIRTMFEIRRGKADERQAELAHFLWNKFQEWLWEEEDGEKKRKKKTPNHDVVSTKVEEMEAFVNALLRTVESSLSRRGGAGGSDTGGAPGSAGGSQGESHLTTRPNSDVSFTSNPVSRPTSVPKTAGSSSSKRKPILKSAQAFTRPKSNINKSVKIDDFSVLEDLNSPPHSPKKQVATPPNSDSMFSNMPNRNTEEATFSFITPMRPIGSKKNKARSPPKFVNEVPTIDLLAHRYRGKEEIDNNESPESPESPGPSSVKSGSMSKFNGPPLTTVPLEKSGSMSKFNGPPLTTVPLEKSGSMSKFNGPPLTTVPLEKSGSMSKFNGPPLTTVPLEKDFPDTVRMMTLPLSPPNVPTHIQPIINKRTELPPLLHTSRTAVTNKKKKNLSKKRSAKTFSNTEKPIIGGNTVLTPVEQNQQEPDHVTKNEQVENGAAEVGQESRIRKVICDIKSMSDTPVKEAETSFPSNETGNTLVQDPESSCQQSEDQDAFNQLREHLQRGDTCPDLIIKSLLTEIDRPQTTPGEMQKQRAILAEHLLKAGWDAEPPFLQREHTEMSLFSLLTRESTQLSDWPSISRESTMEDKRTGVEGGEGYAGLSSRPSECEDPSSELPDDVSALIKRALAQVSGGVQQQDNPGSGSGKTSSAGSNLSSSATDTSPTGPPEPIVTENTFIFARDL